MSENTQSLPILPNSLCFESDIFYIPSSLFLAPLKHPRQGVSCRAYMNVDGEVGVKDGQEDVNGTTTLLAEKEHSGHTQESIFNDKVHVEE